MNLNVGSFPLGLTLNSSTGAINGTPTLTGNYAFQIQVTDSSCTGAVATANFTMTVSAGPLTISSQTPFAATVGSPYSYTVTANGGVAPYTWSITSGSLAPLTLNAGTGVISGTPTTPATLAFTVQVKDSSTTPSTATQALTIVVNTPPLVISTAATLPSANVGQPYTQQIQATGGAPPYASSVVNRVLRDSR